MGNINFLFDGFPKPPDWKIGWNDISKSGLDSIFKRMSDTPQNPIHHGEGDVFKHTCSVCKSLTEMREFRELDPDKRNVLFLSALLHDLGKVYCTEIQDGIIKSPNHAIKGADKARYLLWTEFNMCGTDRLMELRETVCTYVRFHSLPPKALETEDIQRRLRSVSAFGKLLPLFDISGLAMLAEADILGRICGDQKELRNSVDNCRQLALEADCLDGPFHFADGYTKYAYLSGRNVAPEFSLYNEHWGKVIMVCGLPGTGKDTWIKENLPDLKMLSLDDLRDELGISPKEPQSKVIEVFRERAKEYLRDKKPFVFNATNVSKNIRRGNIELFHNYGADVKLIYLETKFSEQFIRNSGREKSVPEGKILDMLKILSPPEPSEAEEIVWLTV